MKTRNLTAGELPREKAISQGVSCLNDAQLLAILLRTGSSACDVLELAGRMLSDCDGRLTTLFGLGSGILLKYPGVGPCKAVEIQAAFELGKRFLMESNSIKRKPLVTSRMVYDLMIPHFKGLAREECWALFVNGHNYPLGRGCVSAGGLESTTIDVRLVIRMALERNSTGVFLLHNHPSGDPHPSAQDISQTEALRRGLNAVGLHLLDHIIVSDGSFFSFADDKMRMV